MGHTIDVVKVGGFVMVQNYFLIPLLFKNDIFLVKTYTRVRLSPLWPSGVSYKPRGLQPGNCSVIFMWRSASVCQTSRFILWDQFRTILASLGIAQGAYCPLLEHRTYCFVLIQNKVAENRLFQFIHTKMGWICISSQNNPEI